MGERAQASRTIPAHDQLSRLVVENERLLRRVLAGFATRRDGLDDLFQDFALHLLESTSGGPEGDPVAWLRRVAKHFAINRLEAAQAKKRSVRLESLQDAPCQIDERLAGVDLQDAIAALSEPQRTAVRLRYAGLTYHEIGDATGVHFTTARDRVIAGGKILAARFSYE